MLFFFTADEITIIDYAGGADRHQLRFSYQQQTFNLNFDNNAVVARPAIPPPTTIISQSLFIISRLYISKAIKQFCFYC